MSAPEGNTELYRLKCIKFLGREVPIVLQKDNGPCPLLAISNILLLRNQIQLPLGAPDVSQDRLISAVAGYLLDCNSEERLLKAGATAEYRANLHRNIADTIATLPKLCTGVDVNVKFHDFRGFEFTDEVAVFDLLDMSLVHGWLVDPQDRHTASILGDKSYNEIVERLVTIMGSETPKHILATMTPLRRTTGSLTSGHKAGSRSSTQPSTPHTELQAAMPQQAKLRQAEAAAASGAAAQPGSAALMDLDGEEAAMLQEALHLSLQDAPDQGSSGVAPLHSPDRAESSPQQPASSSGQSPPDIAGPASVTPEVESGQARAEVAAIVHELVDSAVKTVLAKGKLPMDHWQGQDDAYGLAEQHAADSIASSQQQQLSSSMQGPTHADADSADINAGASTSAEAPLSEPYSQQPSLPSPSYTVSPRQDSTPKARQGSLTQQSEERARELAEAEVISSFLDASTSQLTAHGLVSLQQGLRPRQLAVFFRNNHFNVLFCDEHQLLYLLVTDQGYLWEQDVVWERLCAVNGDTDFVRDDFSSFAERSRAAQAQDAARLAQEAFSSVLPSRGQGSQGPQADSDYALALQLQEEEVQRRQQQQQQQQQHQQQQSRPASTSAQHDGRSNPDLAKSGGRESRQSQDSVSSSRRQSRHSGRASAGSGKDKGSMCKMM